MAEGWVVDASPIIVLAKAGFLHLLDQLASPLVPHAVALEIDDGSPSDPARKALEAGWGRRADPMPVPRSILEWGLGAGESEVLALAMDDDLGQRTALLDDAAARRCARTLGIPLMGTLAVVLRAKREGLISSASEVVSSFLEVGFRIDEEILVQALARGASECWVPKRK